MVFLYALKPDEALIASQRFFEGGLNTPNRLFYYLQKKMVKEAESLLARPACGHSQVYIKARL